MNGINILFNGFQKDIEAMCKAAEGRGSASDIKRFGIVHAGCVGGNVENLSSYPFKAMLTDEGILETPEYNKDQLAWNLLMAGSVYNWKICHPQPENQHQVVLSRWAVQHMQSLIPYDGSYAMVFVRDTDNTVHVVTDMLSTRPLYLRTDKPALSTDIDSLLVLGDTTPNLQFLEAQEQFGFVPREETEHAEIVRLPPATYFVFKDNGQLVHSAPYGKFAPVKGDLEAMLRQAVRSRLEDAENPCILLHDSVGNEAIIRLARETHPDIKAYCSKHGSLHNHVDLVAPSDVIYAKGDDILGYIAKAGHDVVLSSSACSSVLYTDPWNTGLIDPQKYNIFYELVYYFLPMWDQETARVGLEYRTPYTAWQVVSHALAMSREEREKEYV